MPYKIIFTENGRRTYVECLDYLFSELKNAQAALSFLKDFEDQLEILKSNAHWYPVCENKHLRSRKIRKIHLRKHRYKILYRIENEIEVHIDAVYHDLQDYENIIF